MKQFSTVSQRYDKKIISFQERETKWNFTGCQAPIFMIVSLPYINLLNLSWRIKCLFLRNMEPYFVKKKILCSCSYTLSALLSVIIMFGKSGWRLTWCLRSGSSWLNLSFSSDLIPDCNWAVCFVLLQFCDYLCSLVSFHWWGRGPVADRTHTCICDF